MSYFTNFPENSRIWVYPSSKEMSPEVCESILSDLKPFTATWDSHGKPLEADVLILENQFIVFAVDEAVESPSGCSIDRSVKKMKEIGMKYQLDFFNRLKMVVKKDTEKRSVAFSDLDQYAEWFVFNPLIQSVKELNEAFLVPVLESGLVR